MTPKCIKIPLPVWLSQTKIDNYGPTATWNLNKSSIVYVYWHHLHARLQNVSRFVLCDHNTLACGQGFKLRLVG